MEPEVIEQAEQETNADEIRADVESVDVGDFARDDDERLLFRYLRRRSQVAAEIVHLKEQAAAMVRDLENRVKGLDYVYTTLAADVTRRKLAGGKAKSLKTPFGTVGFRRQNARLVVVDNDAALAAATVTPGMEKCVRVKREIAKAELDDYVAASGEIPNGCEMAPETERFFVK